MPGSGAIVEAIAFASGKRPYVVGKPNPLALEIIRKRYDIKSEEMLIVGDRLDTDLAFAKACGIKSALVLSGNAKKEGLAKIQGIGLAPDMVLASVADLILP
jgi:ribonucleotide monophosphatase NagD (HAD superfamily)